jgi:hypothetical protein
VKPHVVRLHKCYLRKQPPSLLQGITQTCCTHNTKSVRGIKMRPNSQVILFRCLLRQDFFLPLFHNPFSS